MKKYFILMIGFFVTALTLNAQLIKNDFLKGYSVGEEIEKARYKEGRPGNWDPIKKDQWNLTRDPKSWGGINPNAVEALVYDGYPESGKDVAIELPHLNEGTRTTVYSLTREEGEYGAGTYYLSFLVNVDYVKKTPIEFLAFDSDFSGTTQRVRFTIKGLTDKTFQVGLNGSNKTEDVVLDDTACNYGTTYLVVLKAKFDADGNGECQLFLNPTPGKSAPKANITTELKGLKSIKGLTVRQRNDAFGAKVGGFRFTKSWKSIFK